MISDIAEDSLGFIWVATPSGLNRFDGYDFRTYQHVPGDANSLGNNHVNKLLVDKQGGLWVAHNRGLDLWNPISGKFVKVQIDSVSTVHHIVQGKGDDIWIVDNRRNIHRLKRNGYEVIEAIKLPQRIPDDPSKFDQIRKVLVDGDNRMWIHASVFLGFINLDTPESQIQFLDWDIFKDKDELPLDSAIMEYGLSIDNRLQGLIQGKDGQVFIYDEGFLTSIQLRQTRSHKILDDERLTEGKFLRGRYDGFIDGTGLLWLYTTEQYAQIGVDLNSMSSQKGYEVVFRDINVGVTRIMGSTNGIVWAGTNGNGLYKGVKNKQIFDSSPVSSKIEYESVYPIYKDDQGHVWFFANRRIYVIPAGDDIPRELSFLENDTVLGQGKKEIDFSAKFIKGDLQGGLWIGNYNGMYHFDTDEDEVVDYKFYAISQKSRNESEDYLRGVYDLVYDHSGNAWITTAGEFGSFDPTTGVFDGKPFITEFITFDDNRITNKLVQKDKETFWIGTIQGLFKYDVSSGTFSHFQHESNNSNSLTSNSIKSIWKDPNDSSVLWIGMKDAGLDRFDTESESFTNFNKGDGLPDGTVYGILNQGNEKLWLSTNKGLCAFDLNDYGAQNYSSVDGLQDDEFNTRSYSQASDGELLFGGIYGFNRFYPNDLFVSDFQPKSVITELKINNEIVHFSDSSTVLSHPIEVATDVFVNPDVRMLSFEVVGLDFSTPQNTQYKYQLQNYDEEWNDLGRERTITYTSLPYGDFVLRVISTNQSGDWSDQIREINIHVLSPWWRKWWAYLAYVLLGVAAVIAIYRAQMKRDNEKREAKRLLELDNLKSTLFTNITHEFRTPLTVISGMADMVDNQEKYMQPIRKNADDLLQMVNQILDLAKLDSNKLEITYINDNIVDYLRYLTESLRSAFKLQSKELSFGSDVAALQMDFDELKIRQIIYNLLSNALKFTEPGDKVSVNVHVANNNLHIAVRDTGIGIAKDKLPHIFNRFYQVDDSSTRKGQGTGIGLALSAELVKLLEGNLEVESELGKGSTFKLSLPIRNEHPAGSFSKFDKPLEMTEELEVEHAKEEQREKPLLLLIEDNAEIVRYVKLLLESGYQIVHAENGAVGITEAISRIPDIIISDVMMPEKNGYEVTETLKADMRTSHIPIVLLTAKSTQVDKNFGLKKGADAYLNKPFDKTELQIRLSKLIELRETLKNRFSDLEPSENADDQLENEFIAQVKEIVLKYIDVTDFKVEDLERELHLSRMQLYRKLKALTGMSPNSVIRDIRLNEGVKLLSQGKLNVSEIAYAVGFSDPGYFTRAFRNKYGVSPSKYKV